MMNDNKNTDPVKEEVKKETLRLLAQLSVEERRLVLREYAEKYGWVI